MDNDIGRMAVQGVLEPGIDSILADRNDGAMYTAPLRAAEGGYVDETVQVPLVDKVGDAYRTDVECERHLHRTGPLTRH
jgi:hypothetical protein